MTSTGEINIETGATIAFNGEPRSLPLILQGNTSIYSYSFITTLELIQGSNSITVTAIDNQNNSASDTITVNADIPPIAIRAELTWDTNDTDLDSHLIAPCYAENDPFGDCNYENRNPHWGNNSTGDPSMDADITTGYGPEHIVLIDPPFNGVYQYKVDYFADRGHGPSTATVKIWINDVLVFEGNKTLSNHEWWDCACISWPSGNVTAGPCSTHTLTVTSNGCCPIQVEGLPCGDQTVPAGNTTAFYGIPENTEITLTAQTGDGECNFDHWVLDDVVPDSGNILDFLMDSDHTADCVCLSPTPTLVP
jgi:hypothetical protein